MKTNAFSLIMLFCITLCLPIVAHSETQLSYATFFPATHIQSKTAEAWCEEVKQKTQGTVEVNFFPGQTLVKAPQIYDAVVEGIADIGFGVLAYHRGRFPLMAAMDLPLGYSSGVQASQIANALYEQFKPQEFHDVHVLYFHAHGPGFLHTAKTPIKKLADWQGMKIRATGNSAALVLALGGTPVASSITEAYQAIQKGAVDGGMYPMSSNQGWRMAEVVDYMTEAKSIAYTTAFYVVMNKEKWNALSQAEQEALTQLSARYILKHGQAWDSADATGRNAFLEHGNSIISIDAQEDEKWRIAVQPLIQEYITSVNQKGLNGQVIIQFISSALSTQ